MMNLGDLDPYLPGAAMPQPATDCNVLLGILAMQVDFISRDALARAMHTWAQDRSRTLGEVLVEQQALRAEDAPLLEALVQVHIKQHGNNPAQSLATLSSIGSVKTDLKKIEDPEVAASLAQVGIARSTADIAGTLDDLPSDAASTAGVPGSSSQRFRILKAHARGGLGEVFLARDEELQREVALKEIQLRHAFNDQSRGRFKLEAEITGGLEHPGIVPVYGMGQYADGRPYYAMRFIRGDSLKEAIERYHQVSRDPKGSESTLLEFRKLLARFLDVCNAIAYAHSRSVVHRDLKPANVMLGKFGETLVVDWGLAKAAGAASAATFAEPGSAADATIGEQPLRPASLSGTSETQAGAAIGTPQYMSPEQAAGKLDQVGPASDVYSLGATFYHLLTGQAPILGTSVAEVLDKVQKGDFPPPRQIQPTIPPALEAICLKAMSQKPEDRYASPRFLADDIEHWLADEPVCAWREPWTVRAGRWMRRHRTLVSTGAALLFSSVILLTVGLVLLELEKDRTEEQRVQAVRNFQEAQAAKLQAETERDRATKNFKLARDAVDKFYTQVAESPEMKEKGVEGLRTKLLETAAEFYQTFTKEKADDAKLRAAQAAAIQRLGNIYQSLSRLVDAENAYRQVFALRENLAADITRAPEFRDEVAAAYNHLAVIYKDTGRPTKAFQAYQDALRIQNKLQADYPQSIQFQQSLALTYCNMATLKTTLGRMVDAENAYNMAVKLQRKLAAAHPDKPDASGHLAATLNNLGNLYKSLGRQADAQAAYNEALAIQKSLAKAQPMSAQCQQELGRSLNNIGILFKNSNRNAEADEAFHDCLAIRQTLVEHHPNVAEYHAELASIWYNLGNYYAKIKKTAKAENSYNKAQRMQTSLVTYYPKVLAYQRQLGKTYTNCASLYQGLGRTTKAEEEWKNAFGIWKILATDYPDDNEFQAELAATLLNLARMQFANGRKDAGKNSLDDSIAIHEKLTVSFPKEIVYHHNLAMGYFDLADLYSKAGRSDMAEKTYEKVLVIQKQLIGKSPQRSDYLQEMAWTYNNLAGEYRKTNRAGLAEEAFRKALALQKKLAAEYPEVTKYQTDLGFTLRTNGNFLRDSEKLTAALENYGEAIATLKVVLKHKQPDTRARFFLRDTYRNRAICLRKLDRHSDALADWNEVLELTDPKDRLSFRVQKALCLARAKDHVDASKLADELQAATNTTAGNTYDLACVHAISLGAVSADIKLTAKEKQALQAKYAQLALAMLARAKSAGHFKNAANIKLLKQDKDLAPLRSRADFKLFLAEVEKEATPKPNK